MSSTGAGANGIATPDHRDDSRFRQGMSLLCGACTIVTTSAGSERAGLTATAVCSVSADPPRLIVCVNRSTRAHALIRRSGALAVNVLSAGQEVLARRFAGMVSGVQGDERFAEGDWHSGAEGVPVLRGALAHFTCRVAEATDSGTHCIFLCDVIDVDAAAPAESALAYMNRRFVHVPAA